MKEDQLDKVTQSLLKKYQLSYFDKQPPLTQFKVIGEDKGLFIIVPENRSWFPTNKTSEIFPMKVKFENEGRRWQLKI